MMGSVPGRGNSRYEGAGAGRNSRVWVSGFRGWISASTNSHSQGSLLRIQSIYLCSDLGVHRMANSFFSFYLASPFYFIPVNHCLLEALSALGFHDLTFHSSSFYLIKLVLLSLPAFT